MKALLVLAFSLIFFSVYAENPEKPNRFKHQVQIGYGYNTFNRIYPFMFSNPTSNSSENDDWEFTFRLRGVEKIRIISSINLYYHVKIKDKGSFGITATTDFFKRTYETRAKDSILSMKETAKIYTLMPNLYYHYLNNKTVRLYFGFEAGIMLINVKNTERNYHQTLDKGVGIIPTFNISPIGIRLKYKVSPYMQLNFGSRGLIEGGISYGFGE